MAHMSFSFVLTFHVLFQCRISILSQLAYSVFLSIPFIVSKLQQFYAYSEPCIESHQPLTLNKNPAALWQSQDGAHVLLVVLLQTFRPRLAFVGAVRLGLKIVRVDLSGGRKTTLDSVQPWICLASTLFFPICVGRGDVLLLAR